MTTAAGWHADPTQRHQLRYWDGTQWTEHVSDNSVTAVDPMTAAAAPPVPPTPPKQGGGWFDKVTQAAQSATEQSTKWIDENLNTPSSGQPSPGPTPTNSAPPAASSPPPAASSSPPPVGSASPPPASAAAPPVASVPPSPSGDVADQLRKLAELRDEGILTQSEFDAQKAKLLGT